MMIYDMGYGLWVMGYGLWVVGCGLWVVGYGLNKKLLYREGLIYIIHI
jgi:hypothetical protein